MRPRRRELLAAALAWPLVLRAADEDEATWARLRQGGLVLLMRHASTEAGYGDPKEFRLDDCRTQRNLSEQGRGEARRVGERLKQRGVPVGSVFTSPWCRCRETAMLAFGHAEDWEPLSSFFDVPDREHDYTERVKKRIAGYARRPPAGNVVMVTHNVNIAALSRLSVSPAELVVMRPDGCCGARPMERLKP